MGRIILSKRLTMSRGSKTRPLLLLVIPLSHFSAKGSFCANPRLHLSVWPASINSLSMVGIGKSAIAASNA